MIAGYVVFITVFSSFIISLAVRWSKLKKDQQTLKDMEQDN